MNEAPWVESGQLPYLWFEENYSRFALTEDEILGRSQPYNYSDAPHISCIYFLLQGSEVVYVGVTNNFQRRSFQHQESGKQFDRFALITDVPPKYLEAVECFYIHWMRPIYNEKLPILHYCWDEALEDLRRRGLCYQTTVYTQFGHGVTKIARERIPADG